MLASLAVLNETFSVIFKHRPQFRILDTSRFLGTTLDYELQFLIFCINKRTATINVTFKKSVWRLYQITADKRLDAPRTHSKNHLPKKIDHVEMSVSHTSVVFEGKKKMSKPKMRKLDAKFFVFGLIAFTYFRHFCFV